MESAGWFLSLAAFFFPVVDGSFELYCGDPNMESAGWFLSLAAFFFPFVDFLIFDFCDFCDFFIFDFFGFRDFFDLSISLSNPKRQLFSVGVRFSRSAGVRSSRIFA